MRDTSSSSSNFNAYSSFDTSTYSLELENLTKEQQDELFTKYGNVFFSDIDQLPDLQKWINENTTDDWQELQLIIKDLVDSERKNIGYYPYWAPFVSYLGKLLGISGFLIKLDEWIGCNTTRTVNQIISNISFVIPDGLNISETALQNISFTIAVMLANGTTIEQETFFSSNNSDVNISMPEGVSYQSNTCSSEPLYLTFNMLFFWVSFWASKGIDRYTAEYSSRLQIFDDLYRQSRRAAIEAFKQDIAISEQGEAELSGQLCLMLYIRAKVWQKFNQIIPISNLDSKQHIIADLSFIIDIMHERQDAAEMQIDILSNPEKIQLLINDLANAMAQNSFPINPILNLFLCRNPKHRKISPIDAKFYFEKHLGTETENEHTAEEISKIIFQNYFSTGIGFYATMYHKEYKYKKDTKGNIRKVLKYIASRIASHAGKQNREAVNTVTDSAISFSDAVPSSISGAGLSNIIFGISCAIFYPVSIVATLLQTNFSLNGEKFETMYKELENLVSKMYIENYLSIAQSQFRAKTILRKIQTIIGATFLEIAELKGAEYTKFDDAHLVFITVQMLKALINLDIEQHERFKIAQVEPIVHTLSTAITPNLAVGSCGLGNIYVIKGISERALLLSLSTYLSSLDLSISSESSDEIVL